MAIAEMFHEMFHDIFKKFTMIQKFVRWLKSVSKPVIGKYLL